MNQKPKLWPNVYCILFHDVRVVLCHDFAMNQLMTNILNKNDPTLGRKVFQLKQASRARTSNYIPQYIMWDVITYFPAVIPASGTIPTYTYIYIYIYTHIYIYHHGPVNWYNMYKLLTATHIQNHYTNQIEPHTVFQCIFKKCIYIYWVIEILPAASKPSMRILTCRSLPARKDSAPTSFDSHKLIMRKKISN